MESRVVYVREVQILDFWKVKVTILTIYFLNGVKGLIGVEKSFGHNRKKYSHALGLGEKRRDKEEGER